MQSRKKAWIVFIEIALCGFLVRSGQILMILLAFQFNQIFTNPAQIIFLLPIAATIVIILGLLALIEIECGRFVGTLDSRLNAIKFYLGHIQDSNYQNYLSKIFLPVAINLASIPVIFAFLLWTSPILFALLIVSTIASGIIVYNFNKRLSSIEGKKKELPGTRFHFNEENNVPLYYLRAAEENPRSKIRQFNDSFGPQNPALSIRSRKKNYLNLIRQITRVVILITGVVLAILGLTSFAKVAGFFIIGNTFRSGCIAIFESAFNFNSLPSIREMINILSLSLSEQEELDDKMSGIYSSFIQKRLKFNNKYSQLINQNPFIRFKDVSINDIDGAKIVSNLTSRISLMPLTFIIIPNNAMANRINRLLSSRNNHEMHGESNHEVDGEFIVGRRKVNENFFRELNIHDPINLPVMSLDLYDYFDESSSSKLQKLLTENNDILAFLETIVSPGLSIEMHSTKQINQFKSLLQLLIACVEPSCLSILLYGFDCFESNERYMLWRIFNPIFASESIRMIVLSQYITPKEIKSPSYIFSSGMLRKNSK